MTLFDPHFEAALHERNAQGTQRVLRAVTRNHGTIQREGRTLVDVASNDYLRLADHPLLRSRSAEWAQRYGTSARASRLVTGTLDLHEAVEEKIAAFKKTNSALLFASGWQANAAVIPALCALSQAQTGHKILAFTDRLNHASLHHGFAAAGIRQNRFAHNDLVHLEHLLERHADTPGLRMIVTESVFSMDGDRADIAALRAIADRHQALLYLDEAHSTGVLGQDGRGIADGMADIIMGTCSKAMGGMGAFVAGSTAMRDYLTNFASGLIYSTALPPSVLGAIDAAIEVLPTLNNARSMLHDGASHLRMRLHEAGLSTLDSSTQIIPVVFGTAERTLSAASRLDDAGFLVGAIRPPTVPQGSARLRLALHSGLNLDIIDNLADIIIAEAAK
ncbi:8-amino-7-oxononanoate synthase [Neokomagataea thailandica NBRC 106555]|uniref:8-amino-7-oxononanoate synthase n=2 Tax=Neokomagataea TaxID=1223423 RepID=A0A4Y6V7L8_9PROT|nr:MULTISPECIES: 8-amino-7-oxononanoate synthase [Neokomagataea]QDH24858.1 8-amino-7-oxononanoate synthase [Neokomagataea tanensis]GBR50168.1 8-amino-7-oxononanoate synthase [Neokomagataea thailandica NBRC 106555]